MDNETKPNTSPETEGPAASEADTQPASAARDSKVSYDAATITEQWEWLQFTEQRVNERLLFLIGKHYSDVFEKVLSKPSFWDKPLRRRITMMSYFAVLSALDKVNFHRFEEAVVERERWAAGRPVRKRGSQQLVRGHQLLVRLVLRHSQAMVTAGQFSQMVPWPKSGAASGKLP